MSGLYQNWKDPEVRRYNDSLNMARSNVALEKLKSINNEYSNGKLATLNSEMRALRTTNAVKAVTHSSGSVALGNSERKMYNSFAKMKTNEVTSRVREINAQIKANSKYEGTATRGHIRHKNEVIRERNQAFQRYGHLDTMRAGVSNLRRAYKSLDKEMKPHVKMEKSEKKRKRRRERYGDVKANMLTVERTRELYEYEKMRHFGNVGKSSLKDSINRLRIGTSKGTSLYDKKSAIRTFMTERKLNRLENATAVLGKLTENKDAPKSRMLNNTLGLAGTAGLQQLKGAAIGGMSKGGDNIQSEGIAKYGNKLINKGEMAARIGIITTSKLIHSAPKNLNNMIINSKLKTEAKLYADAVGKKGMGGIINRRILRKKYVMTAKRARYGSLRGGLFKFGFKDGLKNLLDLLKPSNAFRNFKKWFLLMVKNALMGLGSSIGGLLITVAFITMIVIAIVNNAFAFEKINYRFQTLDEYVLGMGMIVWDDDQDLISQYDAWLAAVNEDIENPDDRIERLSDWGVLESADISYTIPPNSGDSFGSEWTFGGITEFNNPNITYTLGNNNNPFQDFRRVKFARSNFTFTLDYGRYFYAPNDKKGKFPPNRYAPYVYDNFFTQYNFSYPAETSTGRTGWKKLSAVPSWSELTYTNGTGAYIDFAWASGQLRDMGMNMMNPQASTFTELEIRKITEPDDDDDPTNDPVIEEYGLCEGIMPYAQSQWGRVTGCKTKAYKEENGLEKSVRMPRGYPGFNPYRLLAYLHTVQFYYNVSKAGNQELAWGIDIAEYNDWHGTNEINWGDMQLRQSVKYAIDMYLWAYFEVVGATPVYDEETGELLFYYAVIKEYNDYEMLMNDGGEHSRVFNNIISPTDNGYQGIGIPAGTSPEWFDGFVEESEVDDDVTMNFYFQSPGSGSGSLAYNYTLMTFSEDYVFLNDENVMSFLTERPFGTVYDSTWQTYNRILACYGLREDYYPSWVLRRKGENWTTFAYPPTWFPEQREYYDDDSGDITRLPPEYG